MECSCKLWPTPGMYVVTSIEFVKRTRATLRSAEFGFFGVCVYTRMHTPRFSGQPASAGDFVLTMTFSRPMRTSCENVGTVLPSFTRKNFALPLVHERTHGSAWLSQARKQIARERTAVLKGLLRIRRQQARNSVRTPEGRTLPLASTRRRSLGFAGREPHSGRSSIPFRLTLFRNRRYSFQLPEPTTTRSP